GATSTRPSPAAAGRGGATPPAANPTPSPPAPPPPGNPARPPNARPAPGAPGTTPPNPPGSANPPPATPPNARTARPPPLPAPFPAGTPTVTRSPARYGPCGPSGVANSGSTFGNLWSASNSVWRPVFCVNNPGKSPAAAGYPACFLFQVQPHFLTTCD